jgi:dynactin 1
MSDEIQDLLRTIRTKDQVIQESSVKIELLDRRMEASKKQADTIVDLENELGKAKRQERTYEEALEQLQQDLDTAEKEIARLKTQVAGQERQASANQAQPNHSQYGSGDMFGEGGMGIGMGMGGFTGPGGPGGEGGSLETSYLLDQIDALRGTVRFLRTENSYLRGQDLIREIEALPPLPEPVSRVETPALDPSGLSDTDEESDELDGSSPFAKPTLRTLATETKMLYRDVIRFSASPKVVDLSELHQRREAMRKGEGGRVWMPKKKMPSYQVQERKLELERLSRRLKGLRDRAGAIEGYS